jgi:hypothetical protein
VRANSEIKKDSMENLSVKELIHEISAHTSGKPNGLMPMPKLMSKRPIFVARN